jgi:hypothetical protein
LFLLLCGLFKVYPLLTAWSDADLQAFVTEYMQDRGRNNEISIGVSIISIITALRIIFVPGFHVLCYAY